MGYPVGISGESFHQDAIGTCLVGQAVLIWHELGNPYDEDALAAIIQGGKLIGHIPRDSWVHDAVHEEGKECLAKILSVEAGESGILSVVLEVDLIVGEVHTFPYGSLS